MKAFVFCLMVLLLFSCVCEDLEILCPLPSTLVIAVEDADSYTVSDASLDAQISGGSDETALLFQLSGATQGSGQSLEGLVLNVGETLVQWSASCGADAAPYFRIFNPVLQGEKFDPDGPGFSWSPC